MSLHSIIFYEDLQSLIEELTASDHLIIDENVYNLYKNVFENSSFSVLQASEKNKSLKSLEVFTEKLLKAGINRNSLITAIGGGITTDFTGFLASVYMRGIKFNYVPTTLLSMVDASIGGKTAVNFNGYKNILGTFNLPQKVFICPDFLKTLPAAEIRNGTAEMIKHAWIDGGALLDQLENGVNVSLDSIKKAQNIKLEIVKSDYREKDYRQLLNFGHTFGHAIESYKKIPHGSAVAIGMLIAAKISHNRKILSTSDLTRLSNLLTQYKFPLIWTEPEQLLPYLLVDKKGSNDEIKVILTKGPGEMVVKSFTSDELLKEVKKAQFENQ